MHSIDYLSPARPRVELLPYALLLRERRTSDACIHNARLDLPALLPFTVACAFPFDATPRCDVLHIYRSSVRYTSFMAFMCVPNTHAFCAVAGPLTYLRACCNSLVSAARYHLLPPTCSYRHCRHLITMLSRLLPVPDRLFDAPCLPTYRLFSRHSPVVRLPFLS